MKEDAPKDGDVSPIIQSVSNLADENKASTSKAKKVEPSSELRPNFSRVTPAQLGYITFPTDGRYQPVRAVSSKTSLSKAGKAVAAPTSPISTSGLGSERYAGGGGILILSDLRPSEEAEFIEFETTSPPAPPPVEATPAASQQSTPAAPTGLHIALDESAPDADPPEAFEVCNFYINPSCFLM